MPRTLNLVILFLPFMSDSPNSRLAGTYVRVVVLEAAIIVALWLLGRMFS